MEKMTIKDIFQILFTIAIFFFFVYFGNNFLNNIKYKEITTENYLSINNTVQSSNELSLQEKINFERNYILFGKKIIGYKVKDIIKTINY